MILYNLVENSRTIRLYTNINAVKKKQLMNDHKFNFYANQSNPLFDFPNYWLATHYYSIRSYALILVFQFSWDLKI